MITQPELQEVLNYAPETGLFTWIRTSKSSCRKPGDAAGSTNGEGYRQIGISRRYYFAHRLAWLYVHGSWPEGWIDHINGIRTDNRMCNLRIVTARENNFNIRAVRARSGYIGVYQKSSGSFEASIKADGKRRRLGSFGSAEEASNAYQAAKAILHPMPA